MRSYALVLLFTHVLTVTVNRQTHNTVANAKEQLTPLFIECSLGDIVIITAPIVNRKIASVTLTSPKGDERPLDLKFPTNNLTRDSFEISIIIKYDKNKDRVISLLSNYKIINLNKIKLLSDEDDTMFKDHERNMRPNDFMIGPLTEDDHGNWVLSLFAVEENGWTVEMFQVITIEITEYVPAKEPSRTLKPGETFVFGFGYPIKDLESCQFTAPSTTFDRWYDRKQTDLDSCTFVVTNVTKEDEGDWKVVAVGKIVYICHVHLEVD